MTTLLNTPVKLAEARRIIDVLVDLLRPACERIEIAGSVRRGKPEVHDAEVVIIPTPDLLPLTDSLIQSGQAQYALYGEKRSKRWGPSYRGLLFGGIRCELFMTPAESWGYQHWLRTGPGDANAFIMRWLGLKHLRAPIRFQGGYGWYARNWRHDGKGWVAEDKRRLAIRSEDDLFAVLGMPFIPPAERTEMRYKRLTDKRAYPWPDYAPFFDAAPEQLRLFTTRQISQFYDAKDVTEPPNEREARAAAERDYLERLWAIPMEELKAGPPWAMGQWKSRVK